MVRPAGKSRRFSGLLILVMIPILLSNGNLQASTSIDTSPFWDGWSCAYPFGGYDNTATYGQTFTVGADNILTGFSFWLDTSSPLSPSVNFGAYVAEWTGRRAVGPLLYAGGMLSTSGPGGMQEIAISTGNLTLTTGKQYVAFLSISDYYDRNTTYTHMGYLWDWNFHKGLDVFPAGGFVFYNNGGDFSALTTSDWDGPQWFWGGQTLDAAFRANFVAVPEPGAFWLLGSALLGLAGIKKRLIG